MTFSLPQLNKLQKAIKDAGLNVTIREGWHNYCETVVLPESMVIDVHNEDDLPKLNQIINQLNVTHDDPKQRITAKAVAGGNRNWFGLHQTEYSESYSLTPLADAMVQIRNVDKDKVHKIERVSDNVVKVSGSIQIGELSKRLYEEFNLVLPTASLIPYVTVAGLIATAGHGTGRDQPGFAGLVKALTICKQDGTVVRIDRSHTDFQTICSAHLGMFGEIIEVELECMPAKDLECEIVSMPFAEAMQEVDDGLFINEEDEFSTYVELMYMPTYPTNEEGEAISGLADTSNKNNVLIRRMRPVEKSSKTLNYFPDYEHAIQELEIDLEGVFHLEDFFKHAPELIPDFMRYFATRAQIGNQNTKVIGPWYNVWHHLHAYPRPLIDLDLLIPVSKDGHEIKDALKIIDQKLKEYAANGRFPINLAVYVRYFKGTHGALSTSNVGPDQHVVGIDMVALKNTPGAEEFMQEVADILMAEPYYAKPHWGKNLPHLNDKPAASEEAVKEKEAGPSEEKPQKTVYETLYPEMPEYINALERWCAPCGGLQYNAFLNTTDCQILNLPQEYHPVPLPQQEADVVSANSGRIHQNKTAMARVLRGLIKGDNEDALSLKKTLEHMSNSKAYDSTTNLFPASPEFPRQKRSGIERIVVNAMGGEDNIPQTCKLS